MKSDYEMIAEAAQWLLDCSLESMRHGEIFVSAGICFNLETYLDEEVDFEVFVSCLHDCFLTWDKFSGNDDYPIGGKFEYAQANLWQGDSLKLRQDLLRHIIKELS